MVLFALLCKLCLSNQVHAEKDEPSFASSESFKDEHSGPWPKPRPGYTRMLIPVIHIPF